MIHWNYFSKAPQHIAWLPKQTEPSWLLNIHTCPARGSEAKSDLRAASEGGPCSSVGGGSAVGPTIGPAPHTPSASRTRRPAPWHRAPEVWYHNKARAGRYISHHQTVSSFVTHAWIHQSSPGWCEDSLPRPPSPRPVSLGLGPLFITRMMWRFSTHSNASSSSTSSSLFTRG